MRKGGLAAPTWAVFQLDVLSLSRSLALSLSRSLALSHTHTRARTHTHNTHMHIHAPAMQVSNVFASIPATVTTSCEGRQGLLFVGNYDHIPNQHAADFLIRHVIPRLRWRAGREDGDVWAEGCHANRMGRGRGGGEGKAAMQTGAFLRATC